MMTKRFKLSPELADGDHWTVVDTKRSVLEAIEEWFWEHEKERYVGDSFTVEIVEMSDEEVNALPEI